MAQPLESLIADGRERWMESPEYRRLADEAKERARRKFAPELSAAGPLKRLWLGIQMAREIRRELDRLAPESTNWLAAQEPKGK